MDCEGDIAVTARVSRGTRIRTHAVMNAKSSNLIAALDAIVPGFHGACLSDDNYFLQDDGDITVHGVWAYGSSWIHTRLGGMTRAEREALASILNAQVGGKEHDLHDAAISCFIENLAGKPGTEGLRTLLTGEAARTWDRWLGGA